MEKKRVITFDNYEIVNENWRKLFLKMDHEELARRFRLKSDGRWLFISFCRREYRLDKITGVLEDADDTRRTVDFYTRMSILNLFYYAREGAAVCGRFVPFREVRGASPFAPAFVKSVAEELAKPFEGKPEQLRSACIALGGEPVTYGDVGYVIPAFDFMPVMVVFWDGDEDFAAQANLLFDADITDFIHEETVCCVAKSLMKRLREAAGQDTP